jgi:opacity protein-like surface antigen
MKRIILCSLAVIGLMTSSFAQEDVEEDGKKKYLEKGQVTVGMRTTTSFFGKDQIPGLGVGGQTRWQILDYLNTEWFADWITIDLSGAGTRNNAHIGWSVMFYPKQFGRFTPYAIAGHCFDFAKVTPFSTSVLDRSGDVVTRWSSAIQMGLGSHIFLTDRFNISLQAQYMLHLGDQLDYEIQEVSSGYYLDTDPSSTGVGLEGHILLTASLNVRIADLW